MSEWASGAALASGGRLSAPGWSGGSVFLYIMEANVLLVSAQDGLSRKVSLRTFTGFP